MKIKSVIIDDEANARENLHLLINEFCKEIVICGEANSIHTGLALIRDEKPQLVFLDIQLGSQTVFELLEQLDHIDFQIIFVTAHDHFALKAIEFSAIDYLLKPIEIPKLIKAVEKAEKQLQPSKINQRLDNLFQNLKSTTKHNHKIALNTSEGYEMIYVNHIMYCIADGSYTHFHFTDRTTIIVSKNLKHYQGLLEEYNFNRCHNSCLVNLIYIQTIGRTQGGYIKMEDGKMLPISKASRLKLELKIKTSNRLI